MATVATPDEAVPQAAIGIFPSPVWKVWAAIAAVSCAWGTTFLAVRVMVRTIPPLLGGGVRYVLACSLMFGIVLARRRLTGNQTVMFRHGWRVHLSLLVIGVALAGSFSSIGIAEQHIASSLAALLYASVPLWLIVIRIGIGREHIGRVTLAGTAAGFLGVALVLQPRGRACRSRIGGDLPARGRRLGGGDVRGKPAPAAARHGADGGL